MKLNHWKNPRWRRRLWIAATIVLVVVLAAHPELRLLASVLDVMGLDVFVALVAVQFTAHLAVLLGPPLRPAWRRLVPAIRALHRLTSTIGPFRFARDFARYALFNWIDNVGPRWWLRTHTLLRLARLGPLPATVRTSLASAA